MPDPPFKLPLKIEKDFLGALKDSSKPTRTICTAYGRNDEQRFAGRDYIALCVNAHDKLVAKAGAAARYLFDNADDPHGMTILDELNEALALADPAGAEDRP